VGGGNWESCNFLRLRESFVAASVRKDATKKDDSWVFGAQPTQNFTRHRPKTAAAAAERKRQQEEKKAEAERALQVRRSQAALRRALRQAAVEAKKEAVSQRRAALAEKKKKKKREMRRAERAARKAGQAPSASDGSTRRQATKRSQHPSDVQADLWGPGYATTAGQRANRHTDIDDNEVTNAQSKRRK
jgi:hypothetical protein